MVLCLELADVVWDCQPILAFYCVSFHGSSCYVQIHINFDRSEISVCDNKITDENDIWFHKWVKMCTMMIIKLLYLKHTVYCTCEINQLYKHDTIMCICTIWCNKLEPINMVIRMSCCECSHFVTTLQNTDIIDTVSHDNANMADVCLDCIHITRFLKLNSSSNVVPILRVHNFESSE